MFNIMAGSLGGQMPSVEEPGLAVLSVVVNATCNLQCRHCYLAPEGPPVGMQPDQWLRLLSSVFAKLRPHSICFSGKEVFARSDSARLFFDAIQLRDAIQTGSGRRTRVGVITNGTLLERYRDGFSHVLPDWLDISIDGTRDLHDAVRGHGSFDSMARNLPWLSEVLRERLWITPTLMDANIDHLPQMIESLHKEFGLKRFSLGLYKPQSYTDSILRLQDMGRESRILQAVLGLQKIEVAEGVDVRFEFDSSDHLLRKLLEGEGLIPVGGVLRVSERRMDNGVTVRFSTSSVRVGLWRAVRVTNEGHWLAAEDLMDASNYDRRAIGNVADFEYDAQLAYEAGLAHPRFKELFGTTADKFLGTQVVSA